MLVHRRFDTTMNFSMKTSVHKISRLKAIYAQSQESSIQLKTHLLFSSTLPCCVLVGILPAQ